MSDQVDGGRARLGGLRKRVKPFTPVPNATIEDWTLSFRALGLLVRILRMPEGFVIRSEQLANEGQGQTLRGRKANREGRESVRTTLRELSLGGYYRLEKVRTVKGAFVMQNAISEDPDPLWAEQAAIFAGKAVPLYEQADGSLMVRYPDGTLHPDGFPPPEQVAAPSDAHSYDDSDHQDEVEQIPETGFRAPGLRAPVNPASGDAEPGNAAPFKKMVKEDGQQDSVPASQVRRGQPQTRATSGGKTCTNGRQMTLDGSTDPEPSEETPDQKAFGIANAWIKYRADRGIPVAGGNPQHQIKSAVVTFVKAGYTVNEIKIAMNNLGDAIPTRLALQRELETLRTGRRSTPGRPRPRHSGGDVNSSWSELRPAGSQAHSGGASQW